MPKIFITGVDPSLSNFGMVRGWIDLDTNEFHPTALRLCETKPDSSNKTVRKNSQDLERTQQLYKAFQEEITPSDLIAVEIPVGSQSARAMASYGACLGVLASAVEWPMIQLTPTEVKMASVGSKTASKADMIKWATTLYPNLNWFTNTRNGVTTYSNKNEHLADAIAAVHAAIQTNEFKQIAMVRKSIAKAL